MKFEELTSESQDAARLLLSEMLKLKYQGTYDLPDNTVRFLGRQIVKAFTALERDESLPISDSDPA
ncbi:hypothetical protein RGI99_000810 [Morganella morganii]|uniref:hypothetical protein n=1 Tax=Morganella morganii TaxID=582 RepID=UPI002809ABA1|nr:hypothetical protein [Morganella morganii]HDU8552818.1 hypothetical protein [Morganella morganii]